VAVEILGTAAAGAKIVFFVAPVLFLVSLLVGVPCAAGLASADAG
jgi:uncharacterized membrane protein YtjA (UPF0391 family)